MRSLRWKSCLLLWHLSLRHWRLLVKFSTPPRVMDDIRNDSGLVLIVTWCNTRVIWVTQLEMVSAMCELFAKQ